MGPPPQWFVVFTDSRKYLKYLVGLELTLIELVKLKNIAQEVLVSLENQPVYSPDNFCAVSETVCRFLVLEYGLSNRDDFNTGVLPVIGGYYSATAKEILNWIQAEIHYP